MLIFSYKIILLMAGLTEWGENPHCVSATVMRERRRGISRMTAPDLHDKPGDESMARKVGVRGRTRFPNGEQISRYAEKPRHGAAG